jgi:hypothetical protein
LHGREGREREERERGGEGRETKRQGVGWGGERERERERERESGREREREIERVCSGEGVHGGHDREVTKDRGNEERVDVSVSLTSLYH